MQVEILIHWVVHKATKMLMELPKNLIRMQKMHVCHSINYDLLTSEQIKIINIFHCINVYQSII